jgi:hypothetical protein
MEYLVNVKKIAFAKRPVTEKSKFQNTQGSESKCSCYGVGVALLCVLGLRLPLLQAFQQLSHAFFIVCNLTAGRVKTKL